jgi:hypothetical protein
MNMDKKKGEWIEINLPFLAYPSENSFDGLGLNKPGTLVETNKGIFLIGDINQNRGVCDDCEAFSIKEIVKRYKIIWDR